MKTQILLAGILLGAIAIPAAETTANRPNDAALAFERLKSLVGEWESDTGKGKAHLTYEITGGGSALVERETMEKMPPMLTVYYLDGDRVLLTHYCMAGNQPRMQATALDATGALAFRFLDGTNLNNGAGHMHNATLHFVDSRHFSAEWQFYENGSPKATESFQYTRIR